MYEKEINEKIKSNVNDEEESAFETKVIAPQETSKASRYAVLINFITFSIF